MKKIMLNIMMIVLVLILILINQSLFCQTIKKKCPENITYFASTLPIDGDNWFVPIRYDISEKLIDLKIIHKDKKELFIRFKIIENLECNFKDVNNCNLKYRILTYDEETETYGNRQSEIEFKFSDGKGKIYIRHPNFPEISSDANVEDKKK